MTLHLRVGTSTRTCSDEAGTIELEDSTDMEKSQDKAGKKVGLQVKVQDTHYGR